MHQLLRDISRLLLDTILPIRCVVCKKENIDPLCNACLSELQRPDKYYCVECNKGSPFGLTHTRCRSNFASERLVSIFDYKDERCAAAIITGKYNFVQDVFKVFGKALAKDLLPQTMHLKKDNVLITPLPLHERRYRWRGFNQSEIMAKTFAEETGFQFKETLRRTKMTKTQKNLSREQRRANMSDSFAVREHGVLEGKHILLVDDVVTTGNTMRAASKELLKAGASRVWCISIAQD